MNGAILDLTIDQLGYGAAEILQLREERARLLGYDSFAAYKLETEMAKTPEAVRGLLMDVWGPARAQAEADADVLTEMMRADEVFRDVAQHFMRHFDRLLGQRAETDGDTVLAVLAEARSGRAFTLLGQITGVLGTPGPAPEAGGDQPAAS